MSVVPPPPRRLIILRALPGLGDLLCVVPALRALRAGVPGAEVTLLGLPGAAWMTRRFPELIDRLEVLPGFPGLPEQALQLPELLALLTGMQGRYDLALQLHGSGGVTNVLTALTGARRQAGRFRPGQWCPDPATFLPWQEGEPEPLTWLRVVEQLGYPSRGEALAFPIHAEDRAALRETVNLVPGRYAVLHPGASDPARRWAPGHFARVARHLLARGLRVVLTGTAGEAARAGAVRAALGEGDMLDLTGRTSLGTLAALLEGARVLVCGDTGVSHLAAATRTPSVVVFLASDPARWAPLDRGRHRAVGDDVEAALAEVDALLRGETTHAH